MEFTDVYGIKREPGDVWIITSNMTSRHFVEVEEEFVEYLSLTILKPNEFCKILHPYDPKLKKNLFGNEIYKYGPASFFLQPNEELIEIKNIEILSKNEGFLSNY